MTVEQAAREHAAEDAYVLGRSFRELDRLDLQGIVYRGTTRRALTSCGIEKGMRVLDIGCGSGDVTRLVADLVGQSGSVLGIDTNGQSVRSATRRAAQHSYPKSDLYDKVVRWKCRVVAAAGADIEAGLGLYRTFREAKLPDPEMHMEAPVEGGPDSLIYRYMAESVRSMLPMADSLEISGFNPERVARLEARLRDEVVSSGGVLVCWPVVSAWCRKKA